MTEYSSCDSGNGYVDALCREAEAHMEYMACPFCGEIGFDKIGLKSHLTHGDCQEYNNTETITRIGE